ncbi:MAG: ATP-binding protein [Chthoniobacteraceae bacterium]
MNPIHSLRWRIQLWHGALLVVVLSGLGVAAYQYQWASELRRVDGELHERVALLTDVLPHDGGRPPRPNPWNDPSFGPPEPPERRGPPGPPAFHLPAERTVLFDPKIPGACYYVLWRRDSSEWARSAGAPSDVERPQRPPPGELASVDRTRGLRRETFVFTPPGETILVGRSMEPEMAALREYARWLAGIGGAVLVLGLGGGWWLASRAIRPLDAITATAARIADGRLDERINARETDSELGRLAAVLNATFARLETAFAQQARFTADAAHELRTPVSIIISQAQLGLRGERTAGEYREMLGSCLRAANRMEKLTQSLLELARQDAGASTGSAEPCDLAVVARETLELLQPAAAERGLTLDSELAPALCRVDPDRIAQVLLNLVSNALEHTPAGGRILLRTSTDGTSAMASIADTGSGIAPEHLPRVFDRFFRADPSRNRRTGGAGLGLAICKAIADAHGGRLEVASDEGKGSTFTLRLPAA